MSLHYQYADMHCDTLLYGVGKGLNDIYEMPEAMLDIKRLKQADVLCQFLAVFFPPRPDMLTPEQRAKRLQSGRPEMPPDEELFAKAVKLMQDSLAAHKDIIRQAYNYDDVMKNKEQGLISGVLTIEDGRIVNGSFDRLEQLAKTGVRAIALTWNFENCFGAPNSRDPKIMSKGLTAFGKEAIEAMNELGILVDVSHLSDGGFYDVAKISKKPFVATHSDCRALAAHPRNLTDEMIRILAEKGGVSGINFAPAFLDDTPGNEESRINDMVRHVKHFIEIGGEDCIGIGTDFDGIGGHLEVGEPMQLSLLFDALEKAGITPRQIDKIASGNVLRVMKEVMK